MGWLIFYIGIRSASCLSLCLLVCVSICSCAFHTLGQMISNPRTCSPTSCCPSCTRASHNHGTLYCNVSVICCSGVFLLLLVFFSCLLACLTILRQSSWQALN